MADAVSIPVDCPKCGGTATVFVAAWTPESPRQPQSWMCPHCREGIPADMPGKVVWVLARQKPDAPR